MIDKCKKKISWNYKKKKRKKRENERKKQSNTMKSYLIKSLLQVPSASAASTPANFDINIIPSVDDYEEPNKKATIHLNESINSVISENTEVLHEVMH